MITAESRVRRQTREWLSKLSADRHRTIFQEVEAARRSLVGRLIALEGAGVGAEEDLEP